MKQRILVTGGAGYIGSHTVVELQAAGYPVVIVDNLANSNIEVLDGIEAISGIRPDFVQGECTDMDAMRKLFNDYPDIKGIINFAADKAVGESVQKPTKYYRNNLLTLINLLDLMQEHDVNGLVFSSSCTVYGEPDENPVTENTPIKKATSPYGNTKQICEEIITDVVNSGAKFNAVLLRYFNPIGAHPSGLIGELPNGVPNCLVPFLTQTAIGAREVLSVFGNDYNTRDGYCIRDFIDVVDLAKAHVIAVERMLEDKTESQAEIFNLGTGNGVSVMELINTFEEATGVKVPYRMAPRRSGDVEQVWSDPSKANEILGWKSKTPLSETLRNAWTWQLRLREKGIM